MSTVVTIAAHELARLRTNADRWDWLDNNIRTMDTYSGKWSERSTDSLAEFVDACIREDEGGDDCPVCMGTGEGQYDGARCYACKGRG
jgi:hypothetical protein